MAKTILITGASTRIGRARAVLFAERGWNVVATMRNPEKADSSRRYREASIIAAIAPDSARKFFTSAELVGGSF